jgi:hypothetical protein
MKPYTGVIPSYVAAMDAYATRAGLTIRRLLKRHSPRYGDELLLVYSGTREQIERCELVVQPEAIRWPRAKTCQFRSIQICPKSRYHGGRIYKLAAPLYATGFEVDLPRAITAPSPGVECFDFYSDSSGPIAYVGTREALVAAGIAEADMLPDDGTEMEITQERESGFYGGSDTLEESMRLHNGLWAYLKYPHIAKEAEERKRVEAEKELSGYTNPEAWLEAKEDAICAVVGAILSADYCAVDTKAGMRYTVDPAALDSIKNDIEAVAQRIRNIPVKVQSLAPKSTPEALGKAVSAAVDGKFRSFLQSVVDPDQRGHK